MTDRHAGYLVTLDRSIREDDAEAVLNALRMTRGVLTVTPIIDNLDIQMAYEKARMELGARLLTFYREVMDRE